MFEKSTTDYNLLIIGNVHVSSFHLTEGIHFEVRFSGRTFRTFCLNRIKKKTGYMFQALKYSKNV